MKRVVALLGMVALIGCGTAPKKSTDTSVAPKEQETNESGTGARAAQRAAGGAAAGALTCLAFAPTGIGAGGVGVIVTTLAAFVCVPFGVVAGAVVGGAAGAANAPSRTASGRRTNTPAEVAARYRSTGRFVLVSNGQVESGDAVPLGTLQVAMNTIVALEDDKKRASLVIDLERATIEGGRSLVTQTVMNCATGTTLIQRSFLYAETDGDGPLVKAEEHVPPIAVDKPSDALSSAVRTVCEAGPWWNTPAHLYGG